MSETTEKPSVRALRAWDVSSEELRKAHYCRMFDELRANEMMAAMYARKPAMDQAAGLYEKAASEPLTAEQRAMTFRAALPQPATATGTAGEVVRCALALLDASEHNFAMQRASLVHPDMGDAIREAKYADYNATIALLNAARDLREAPAEATAMQDAMRQRRARRATEPSP